MRTLCASGIARRRGVDGERAAGYELTDKGRDLGQVILVLKRWGDTYCNPEVPVVHFMHDECGQVFVPDLHCRSCGAPFRSGELRVQDTADLTEPAP